MNSFLRLLRQLWTSPLGSSTRFVELPESRLRELEELSKSLGYEFRFPVILDRALTHRSYLAEPPAAGTLRIRDYESLEFLGDSILSFVVSEYLLASHPSLTEGELTKTRAFLVSARQLHRLAAGLELGKYLRLGKGEEKTGVRHRRAILADLFESVVAAVYLDGGMAATRSFVLRHFQALLEHLEHGELEFADYKSRLQELLHERGLEPPTYEILEETGPDHQKVFSIVVMVDGKRIAGGTGRSKKEAAQSAAGEAIRQLTR